MAVEGGAAPPAESSDGARRESTLFYRSVLDFLGDLSNEARRFWLMVMLTGAAAGLVAVAFLHLLRFVQLAAWPPGASYLAAVSAAGHERRVIVPALAGLLMTLLWILTRQKLSGHGTPGVIEAIWRKGGRISLPRAFLRDASSIVAVSMGASLGREGALIQTGAATGSWLGARLRLSDAQMRTLCASGAAAGIAAAYNVPIGGAVFGLEVLLGSFALELFGPLVVACVVATLVSRLLIENHPTYAIPRYTLMTTGELVVMPLLGVIIGVASAAYVRAFELVTSIVNRVRGPLAYLLPPVVMAGLGVAAIRYPQLLGNGYDTVDQSLLGQLPLRLLLLLPLLKFAATALCSSAGVPGGLFTPSLYIGALFGGALGTVVHSIWPASAPAGAYALVGMGCVLAGTTHAAVSSVLIIFELTGDYDVILPLMVSCVLAAAISRRLYRDSIYTSSLRRRNVVLPEPPRPEWLRRTLVSSLLEPEAYTVAATLPFAEVALQLIELPAGHDLYVHDADGRYLGAIVLDDLKGHLPQPERLAMVIAADVADRTVAPLLPDVPLSELAQRFARTTLERLPVVDASSGRVIGTVSKGKLVGVGRFA